MAVLQGTIRCDAMCGGAVSRPLESCGPDAAATQTLVACRRELMGASSRGVLALGPPLQLFEEPERLGCHPATPRRRLALSPSHELTSPVWDAYSSAVYMFAGNAVLRLSGDNTLTVVAGRVGAKPRFVDGPGLVARFDTPYFLASDGAGALYVGDEGRIRKLQLPPAEAAGLGQGGQLQVAAEQGSAAAAAAAGGDQPAEGGAAAEQVVVSTLPLQDDLLRPGVGGLAFDGGSTECGGGGRLIFATPHALYRLPLGAAAPAAPVLLAGAKVCEECAADGRGPDARFTWIWGLVLDGEGAVWVMDRPNRGAVTSAVRRVAADGTVKTVVLNVGGRSPNLTILPNGCLAIRHEHGLLVLDLGLKPQPIAAAPCPPAGPPPRTLPGDYGALLDRQPDGTADVTIVVGGRTFHAHRAVLCARSDYFRQRLGGDFADGNAQQLTLPDADPDAFEVTLRFVYTGVADIPPAQAQAVAELADRLLLPELSQEAQAAVEASVSAGTVVGLLLWAEARGPAFCELLSRLKAWYVKHRAAMVGEARDTIKRLAVESPELMGLLEGFRNVKRPRRG
ncbi:ARM REPEAT PROTEIN INTERACTING WITH ABF2 [Tetrabaena socialis]|uniref:ARM REPEAT PROTEIN INTERACTING WITH ABF2 n=1 Tax=Tetrabaena socialis TaxID=47790 RepID=A0A2J7ZQA6_9CHLO|nr:ARM REPEAT PROTEIN INTERACTING WITH ABF2 [Tetrabaena socialis]|eukprot:PNH02447.1 ARM REPEAT PROTEIN INTERACTING WITH ABF2 [Tetrabaena socialis]